MVPLPLTLPVYVELAHIRVWWCRFLLLSTISFSHLPLRSSSFKLLSPVTCYHPLSSMPPTPRSARSCTDIVSSGIAETFCVIISSSALGRWVDGAPTRLRPLLLTIFANRITLVACCVLWIILFFSTDDNLKKVMFAAILALGMVEKSSRMANVLCMERDWVPTLANANDEGYSLTHMNTTMRRIDIACKILAPLAISEVVVLVSTVPAALAIASVSSVTLVLETWSALRVWRTNSRLRAGKGETQSTSADTARQPESPTTPNDIQLLPQPLDKTEDALARPHAV